MSGLVLKSLSPRDPRVGVPLQRKDRFPPSVVVLMAATATGQTMEIALAMSMTAIVGMNYQGGDHGSARRLWTVMEKYQVYQPHSRRRYNLGLLAAKVC
jgi:hypothetical protein